MTANVNPTSDGTAAANQFLAILPECEEVIGLLEAEGTSVARWRASRFRTSLRRFYEMMDDVDTPEWVQPVKRTRTRKATA